MTDLQNTGERMIPEFHAGSLMYAEHLVRYKAAQNIVKGKTVLDVACGSGYGTKLLAKTSKNVIGIDIDKDTIEFAKKNYGAKNIDYLVGDCTDMPLEDASFDAVVTFETIEHIKDYNKFIKEIKRVLKPDGLVIISTPNSLEFTPGNHFHLHEFKYQELIDILKQDFNNIDSYFQSTSKYVGISPKRTIGEIGEVTQTVSNLYPLTIEQCLYFYLLCSNRKITEKIVPQGALGSLYSDKEYITKWREAQTQQEAHVKHIIRLEKEVGELEKKLKDTRLSNSFIAMLIRKITKNKLSK